jgi:GGDEF domain-containing protein
MRRSAVRSATCCCARSRPGCDPSFAARTTAFARVGGDEFAILMAGSRPSDAQRVAEAVARALEVRMTLDGHVVDVRLEHRRRVCPDHGHDPAKLLQRAEVAMRARRRTSSRS